MHQLFCAISRLLVLQWLIPEHSTSNLMLAIFDMRWLQMANKSVFSSLDLGKSQRHHLISMNR